MRSHIFLLLISAAAVCTNPVGIKKIDLGERMGIANDFLYGDILKPQRTTRLAYTAENIRWTSPIPYVFGEDLGLNAKGVVLKAFDRFRVRTCIDFVPRVSEEFYISVQNLKGCFSNIGKEVADGQVLSLGPNCDQVYLAEHEFLHALGFFHEQCRSDRDNYITIVSANILKGYEDNFNNISNEVSSSFGSPYDYWSVLHYGKDAYTNGNGPTIITKDPKFQNVIGQTLGMSPLNAEELNRFYKCNSTVAFMMYCGFINGTTCQMNQCSQSGTSWVMVTSVGGGPSSDHTSLVSGNPDSGQETGYFMHASTASGQEGDSVRLETQRMDLKRECNVQCLQFYYYHSGNELDELNIWIREFQNEQDSTGTVQLMKQITGPLTAYWKLKHVSLNATKQFQVVFEVRKGAGSSTGGFSIDDINLSEVECPHVTLQIDNIEEKMNAGETNIYSRQHYSTEGYGYRLAVGLSQTFVGLYVQLLSDDFDSKLQWPCYRKQITYQSLDQSPNFQLQMSKQRSITTDQSLPYWTNPRETGTLIVGDDGGKVYAGPLIGLNTFMSLEEMQFRDFIKGGTAIFTLSFQDLTPLVNGSSPPCPEMNPVTTAYPLTRLSESPCLSRALTPTGAHSKSTGNSIAPGMVTSSVLILLLALKHLEF